MKYFYFLLFLILITGGTGKVFAVTTLGEDIQGAGHSITNISTLTIGTNILPPVGGVANITGNVHVNGSIFASNIGGTTPISAGNVSSGTFGSLTGGGNYTFAATDGSTILKTDAVNARVGIGTPSPGAVLQVGSGIIDAQVRIGSDTGNMRRVVFFDTAAIPTKNNFEIALQEVNNALFIGPSTAVGGLIFDTTKGITLLASGNVGIGTTDPGTYKLNVNGAINATQIFVGGVAVTTTGGSNTWTANQTFNNTTVFNNTATFSTINATTINTTNLTATGTISLPNGSITNAMLANSSLTISGGTGLTGGGAISLGGSLTSIALKNTAGLSTCTSGTTSKIIWDSTNSQLICGTDQNTGTTYSAGTGLSLASGVFSADTTYVQRRVSDACAEGSSIRVIASDGTVTCQTDNTGATTINAANVSSGTFGSLTGGGSYRFNDTIGNPVLFTDAGNGRVGIGTAGPTNTLTVINSGNASITLGVGGPYPAVSVSGTNYYKQFQINEPRYGIPVGIIDSGYRIGLAVQGYVETSDFAGTLQNQYGAWIRTGSSGVSPTGNITNSYGLFIDNLTSSNVTITNSYGIYQSASTAKNYFAGSVGIGTVPVYKLDVAGIINATDIKIGGVSIPAAANIPATNTTNTWTTTQTFATTNIQNTIISQNLTLSAITGCTGADKALRLDASGNVVCGTIITGNITGSGTINYLAKWTGGTALGNSVVYETIDGLVGIGTNPSYKLDVVSAGATTARFGTASTDKVVVGGGAGKIDAGTVDPVYTIGGKRYATYLPGMTGVKEETTGVAALAPCEYRDIRYPEDIGYRKYCVNIDFANQKKGSDLWLFAKTTSIEKHFDDMAVLLTPEFDGRVWYEKDAENLRLVIYGGSTPPGRGRTSKALKVSYRLTAPRFDASEWGNESDAEYEGFNLDK